MKTGATQKAIRNHFRKKGCPWCQQCLVILYGTYWRTCVQHVRTGEPVCIQIQRLFCNCCKKTFSFLPAFLIRNKQYLATELHKSFSLLMNGCSLAGALKWSRMDTRTFRQYIFWHENHAGRILDLLHQADGALYQVLHRIPVPDLKNRIRGTLLAELWVKSGEATKWLPQIAGIQGKISRLTLIQFIWRNNITLTAQELSQ